MQVLCTEEPLVALACWASVLRSIVRAVQQDRKFRVSFQQALFNINFTFILSKEKKSFWRKSPVPQPHTREIEHRSFHCDSGKEINMTTRALLFFAKTGKSWQLIRCFILLGDFGQGKSMEQPFWLLQMPQRAENPFLA